LSKDIHLKINSFFLYTSPSHKTVLEINLNEGDSFPSEIFHEEDFENVLFHFKQVLETKEQGCVECRIRHGEGHFVWLDTKITPVYEMF
jgi:hypothetical protein